MNAAPVPAPVPAWRLMATLGTTALIAGVLVVSAYELTLPRIQENRQVMLELALRQVIPGAARFRAFRMGPAGLVPVATVVIDDAVVYAGYDAQGRLMALALPASARGYQDVLRLLYAYAPDCQCITAIHVLRSSETPGIGDKITTDPAFRANFQALDARLDNRHGALAHPIVTVRHGTKADAWQIDAISGATVTSRAVGRALNASAQAALPQVVPRLDAVRRLPEER
jgi:Na+-translocating ferredoxin:NAD+ oxidoreductase subunit G